MRDDAIAIVGLSCRLPGAADPASFWRLLADGAHGLGPAPDDRWDPADFGDDLPPAFGAQLRRAGYLDQIADFDPGFFGIAPREATAMDPQQRLVLELAWEALEDAGTVPATLRGSATGVFVGVMNDDYASLIHQQGPAVVDAHTLAGLSRGVLANRVSYLLGTRGPSLSVDSAQSSSLVAVHLAAESLRRGESTLAIAGGVNLMANPESTLGPAEFGGLSPDGLSYTFDARANGYVRGEGGGLVVLKPLAAARRDGDRVYCVLRGSAVNSDGAGINLTAPDQEAQREVIRAALADAEVEPGEVQYVELHGTGTAVGDPVEAGALGEAVGATRPTPLAVGSVKTNIGHLEGAAGIAGLLKTALAIWRRELPPSLNYEQPNPRIPLDELNLRVRTTTGAWPTPERPLVAGVSSFGMGGTNCHVVLAQHTTDDLEPGQPAQADSAPRATRPAPPSAVAWPLSGRTDQALRDQARRLHAHLVDQPDAAPADIGFSLATTRATFEHRAVAVGRDRQHLVGAVEALAAGRPAPGLVAGTTEDARRVVFVFPGQGSQWVAMGRELLDSCEAFATMAGACDSTFAPLTGWSVLDVLRDAPGAADLNRTDVVQPALFTVMVSLAAAWQAHGVRPAAVVGHSQGEVAAAYTAGGLSLADAARVVALRSRAWATLSGAGATGSVLLPAEEVRRRLDERGSSLVIAAANGPSACAISGAPEELDTFVADLTADGVTARRVPGMAFAGHSPQVDAVRERILADLADVSPLPGTIPFYSTVTGGLFDTTGLDTDYWYRNMRQRVEYAAATDALLAAGHDLFIEASPHMVLGGPTQESIERAGARADYLGTLRREHGGLDQLLTALGAAHVQGAPVDWATTLTPGSARRVDLPTYAFQRQRYWTGQVAPRAAATATTAPPTEGETAPRAAGQGHGSALHHLLTESDRAPREVAEEFVRSHVAAILGYQDHEAVPAGRPFKALGFDSSMSVELRNTLARASGTDLATTLLFDYPTPSAVAGHLVARLLGEDDTVAQRVGAVGVSADEPLAIVGMGCRLPGGVASPEDLWELVSQGRDGMRPFPDDRGWDLAAAEADAEGGLAPVAGFLDDVAGFDAEFFGIAPREALGMDPQQRLLLETSWEALERAGIDPASLRGSRTGVFVGAMAQDYGPRMYEADADLRGFLLTGNSPSVASGRLAYVLGLEGPALTVDTACSSSLVALHLAGQALRGGECDVALVGGVAVLASPGMFVEFARQGGLAGDGRCKAFAGGADGTGWAEGAGVLVVERLSDARRLGHRVLAVVRGSAVNQDGASNGLTAPNGPSQQRVIRQALASARLSAAEVDAVEAHGTGTRLGDPIEAQALLATYGQGRPEDRPLWLGSLKSNIGHAQAAAGVAGVIKMVEALRNETLPRTLHVDEPSPRVDWSAGAVELLTEARPWTVDEGGVRRAGVSSFGISGTNAHVILEQAPPEQPAEDADRHTAEPPVVLPLALSARSAKAVGELATGVAEAVRGGADLAEMAAGLARRATFAHRAVVIGGGREELAAALEGVARGETPADAVVGAVGRGGRIGFVFPGQGAQWAGMAVELARTSPAFRERLDACAQALEPLVDWSLHEVLAADPDTGWLERVDVVQPALWAVMVSLAEAWRSFGVRPGAVVGHSQGEIAAAVVAGGLTLEDGARVVALRSRVIAELAGAGSMLSVNLPVAEVEDLLGRWDGRVSVAAVNGPGMVVVSGDAQAVTEVHETCLAAEVRARLIPVTYASHSAHVEALRERILTDLAPIRPVSGTIPLYSSLTASVIDTAEMDAGYWYRNLRGTVDFAGASTAMLRDGFDAFIECSPHPVLTAGIEGSAEATATQATVIGSLRRDEGGMPRFAHSLATAFVHGLPVDLGHLVPPGTRPAPGLPTYPFQRERFWLAPRTTTGGAPVGQAASTHPFLDAAVDLADDAGLVLTGSLSSHTHPWLKDHAVWGRAIVPGTALAELALYAGDQVGCPVLEELTLHTPLALPDQGTVAVQIVIGAADDTGRHTIGLHSRPAHADGPQPWTVHATGVLATGPETPGAESAARAAEAWPPPGATSVATDDAYRHLAEAGYDYGPAFQGLRALWTADGAAYAEVELPSDVRDDADRFALHPALWDATLHAIALAGLSDTDGGTPLPFSWADVTLHAVAATRLRVHLRAIGRDTVSLHALDTAGQPVLSVESLTLRAATTEQPGTTATHDSLYALDWVTGQPPAAPAAERWAVLGTPPARLAAALAANGHTLATYPDLAALVSSLDDETEPPETVLVTLTTPTSHPAETTHPDPATAETADAQSPRVDTATAAHAAALDALTLAQTWLATPALDGARLTLLTQQAVAVDADEEIGDLAQATARGLWRSAIRENPGRFTLIDLDATDASWAQLPAVLAAGDAEAAVRQGTPRLPRLAQHTSSALDLPADTTWRLDTRARGTFASLAPLPAPEADRPLGPRDVRVRMHAAGLNFRDVLIALDMYPGAGTMGIEGAGTVLETGPDVVAVAPGDTVMGMFSGAFAPVAVTDERHLIPLPEGWTAAQAAATPVVFLTAHHGLCDLGRLGPGDRVLIHAGAGGVGMAAIQLAQHLGAEVFATASPGKWHVLRSLGVADDHLASSRDLDFVERFSAVAGQRGMDVVLNALAGEFVDASLSLLAPGGRFIEMGKTDIRSSEWLASAHPDLTYHFFDLLELAPDHTARLLAELAGHFERGELQPLPVRPWDIRHAQDAYRFLSQAKHIGKIALTLPSQPLGDGTTLITGGTGALGALMARHLVSQYGVRHLLLTSRRGPAAPGADALRAELEAAGAQVTIAACDAADREALAALLATVPAAHPLTAVVHTAGVLDDGVLSAQTPERLASVLRAKADSAWHLHELTRHLPLSAFILFSSVMATLGSAGQSNYTAANAFLDALAQDRRARGLAATSLAWGVWSQTDGMTGHLDEGDRRRLTRAGLRAMEPAEGLALFDAALAADRPLTLPAPLDLTSLRKAPDSAPAVLSGLAGAAQRHRTGRRVAAGQSGPTSFADRLAAVPQAERLPHVLDLVRREAATVLGYDSAAPITADDPFRSLGFDSLTAVELRNRLNTATGLRLPATVTFDHPTPQALVAFILAETGVASAAPRPAVEPVAAVGVSVDEPLAIVGMGCRLPGGVASPEGLWELVSQGRDGMRPFPDDRGWEVPTAAEAGGDFAHRAGFLDDVAGFDAEFFGIAPREALGMDPQQRLLLETSWEALERAGIDPASLRGSRTGVFVGAIAQDYGPRLYETGPERHSSLLTGNTLSVASGRLAYVLGLEGPALTVDTACSSSLVALHLAGQALRGGECDVALVGGVAVLVSPGMFVEFARQGGLAGDGRCKAFAGGADGTGWAEGAGVLVVERLSDARRLGHRVLAVVRGSAVNQDGASNGLTAPNGPSQQRVIRQALASARLSAAEVDAVEAHGTGTRLGDPIEAQALLATYGQGRPEDRPLWLGSLKSNIGHAQAAAGVAGVMKMVLALRHGTLPKTLHVDEPSPRVDWSAGAVELLTEARPWTVDEGGVRRAGVSAFGISGTNAHVILEQAPADLDPEPATQPLADEAADGQDAAALVPLVLTGRSAGVVSTLAGGVADVLRDGAGVHEVAAGLAGRAAFGHRAVVLGTEREQLVASLEALARGELGADVVTGQAGPVGRTGFVFPGQGGQWAGMAVELLDTSPTFAALIDECAEALSEFVDWSLLDVLRGAPDAPDPDRVDVVQPALWAVMVSLAGLWRSFGVEPSAVVGHSQGEIAAACVTGGLSLADGARVVALRSRAIGELLSAGTMLSVALPVADVEKLLEQWDGRASVAAVNGPGSVVVSGDVSAVDEVRLACEDRGARTRVIPVDYASHSVHVEALYERLLADLAPVSPTSGTIPLYSSVTGEPLDTAEMGAEYWYRNLRGKVDFAGATRAMLRDGVTAFVECSPHPVLAAGVEASAEDADTDALVVGSLRRGEGGMRQFAHGLASAYAHGLPVDFTPLLPAGVRPAENVPTYPFEHERFWLAPRAAATGTPAGQAALRHPFLDAAVDVAGDGGLVLTGSVTPGDHAWLVDHAVHGQPIMPGAAWAELALRAGEHVGLPVVDELTLHTPLVLPETGSLALQLVLGAPDDDGQRIVTLYSRPQDAPTTTPWDRHGEAVLSPTVDDNTPRAEASWPPAGATPLAIDGAYERFADRGIHIGPSLQGLRAVWRRGEQLLAEIDPPYADATEAEQFSLHPALLTTALLTLMPGLTPDATTDEIRLPFSWAGLHLHQTGASRLRVTLTPTGDTYRVDATDTDGAPVAHIRTVTLRPLPAASQALAREGLLALDWVPLPVDSAPPTTGTPHAIALCPPGPAADRLVSAVGHLVDRYDHLGALRDALDAGASAPAIVYVPHITDRAELTAPGGPDEPLAAAARAATGHALALVQSWLGDARFAATRLVFVTQSAVAAGPDESVHDLVHAPIWGLIRVAQQEHPDRFALLDLDADSSENPAIALAQALHTAETQFALRDGALRVPRMARTTGEPPTTAPAPFRPGGTVLVTGGTGGLGALLAQHLVDTHDVRHLLLISRSGPKALGAAELAERLTEAGAQVTIAACDAADREALAAVLAAIPAEHPLTSVVHTAGVLDDAVMTALTLDQIDYVFRPKVDAVLNLHRLTRDTNLSSFLLYSSVAGHLAGFGSGSYSAANAFVDAFAAHRRASGLPAASLVWGLWEEGNGMKGRLNRTGLSGLAAVGLVPMDAPKALALFDAALTVDRPLLLPLGLEPTALRAAAASDSLPLILSGLVRTTTRRPAATAASTTPATLAQRLAGATETERHQILVDTVRAEVATVLGFPHPAAIDQDRVFTELGFDSVSGLMLRNRLNTLAGTKLPTTIVYDAPTANALAQYLATELAPATPADAPTGAAEAEDETRLRAVLASVPLERLRAAGLVDTLLSLAEESDQADTAPAAQAADEAEDEDLDALDLEQLVQMALDSDEH
ncbi:SDR family NAD(P)-dependent oxidoreductase [Streptomyces buecherae]|uniref:SDR family NAD(P)-dependent oxidoreductase n=1 Tax=Streptomyces buecherae TaxID=2763006 RepID=UPI0036A9E3AC